MMSPKISIIIPAFNVERHISRCLDGLFRQTCRDWEALVVDNASADCTAKIIQDFAQKDSRIKYHLQKIQGPAAARNMALDNALGEYLMFCDADDWYNPDMCEKMLRAMSDPTIDFAVCHQNIVREDAEAADKRKNVHRNWPYPVSNCAKDLDEELKTRTEAPVWNKIFKKSVIEKYGIRFPEGHLCDDAVFCWNYVSVSKRAYFLNERLYNYALVSGSIVEQMFDMDIPHADLVDHVHAGLCIYEFLKKHHIFDEHKAFFNIHFRDEIGWALQRLGNAVMDDFLHTVRRDMQACAFNADDLDNPELKNLFESVMTGNFAAARDFIDLYRPERREFNSQPDVTPAFDKNNVPVVFNCDNNFFDYLGVAIQSVIENSTPGNNYDIIVLTQGFTRQNEERLALLNALRSNVSIRAVYLQRYVPDDLISQFFTRNKRLSKIAYARLFISDILKNYDKALYLDCDLACNADIAELYHTDLGSMVIAAVRDLSLSDKLIFHKLKLEIQNYLHEPWRIERMEDYFNSGVMVMDLAKIRAEGLMERFIEVAKSNQAHWADQDVLNAALQGRVKWLDFVWNYQSFLHPLVKATAKLRANGEPGKIIHFCGEDKPLHFRRDDSFLVWWKYVDKLSWKSFIYLTEFIQRAEALNAKQKAEPGKARKFLANMVRLGFFARVGNKVKYKIFGRCFLSIERFGGRRRVIIFGLIRYIY